MIESIKSKKYHWYNNGTEAKMFSEYDDIPEGFVSGRRIK